MNDAVMRHMKNAIHVELIAKKMIVLAIPTVQFVLLDLLEPPDHSDHKDRLGEYSTAIIFDLRYI